MPELPEIETIRRSLEETLLGKIIADIKVLEPKQFTGDISQAKNQSVIALQRKGKVLILALSNNLFINIHLKLTGQVLFAADKNNAVFQKIIPLAESNTLPAKTTRVIIEFADGAALFFNDLRKFGWVKLGATQEGPTSVDVLSPEFTLEFFLSKLSSKKPIKVLLMDQEVLAGIGNIYANDSLWEAKINPLTRALDMSKEQGKNLYEGIKKIIAEGVATRGSSAKDEIYVLPDGGAGTYQKFFKTYHQDGKPCKHCGGIIIRIKQAGRGTFYCPICQPTHTESHQSVIDPPLF